MLFNKFFNSFNIFYYKFLSFVNYNKFFNISKDLVFKFKFFVSEFNILNKFLINGIFSEFISNANFAPSYSFVNYFIKSKSNYRQLKISFPVYLN